MTETRRPLSEYLGPDADKEFNRLPPEFCFAPAGDEDFTATWIANDGVQVVASVRDFDERVIHVTIAPVYALRPELRKEDMEEYLAMRVPKILQQFFPGRAFERQEDDPRVPSAKHYMSPV